MWPKQYKKIYTSFLWREIYKLPPDTTFSVDELFAKSKDPIKPFEIRDTLLRFRYDVRVNCEITEISENIYNNRKPEFSQKPDPFEFNKDTSVQELFNYIITIFKNCPIKNDEKFLLRELFPGIVWNRLPQKQKLDLGNLVEMYNIRKGKMLENEYFALVGRTKQGQNIYQGLYDEEYEDFDNWLNYDLSQLESNSSSWLKKI